MFASVLSFPGMPLWLLVSCLFLCGFFLSGQFLGFSMTCALNPLSVSGTAGGFHNMVCMLSGVIFPPLIGWILQGGEETAVRTFTVAEYTVALSTIGIALLAACGIIFLIKEKYPKDVLLSNH
jgi:fucose permease